MQLQCIRDHNPGAEWTAITTTSRQNQSNNDLIIIFIATFLWIFIFIFKHNLHLKFNFAFGKSVIKVRTMKAFSKLIINSPLFYKNSWLK